MKIGRVTLSNPYILAPMAGVSDMPFRILCAEQGAGMVCMEMVSAKALAYHNKNTHALLRMCEQERPISLQLFGSDPQIMAEQAGALEELPFDILDINMGCPVPKVVKNGEGSALMKDPLLAGRIIESMAKAMAKPVTVKIRKGFDEEHVNAPEIAYIAQESGAAAVAVHARTREQYYSGRADWEIIAKVKQKVSIPVIGNGDVTCREDALAMIRQTCCDGVMVGRAARGNPWIFAQLLSGSEPPALRERVDMILRHAGMQCEYNGEEMGILQMRKHVAWYTVGLQHSAGLRRDVNHVQTYAQLEELMECFLKRF